MSSQEPNVPQLSVSVSEAAPAFTWTRSTCRYPSRRRFRPPQRRLAGRYPERSCRTRCPGRPRRTKVSIVLPEAACLSTHEAVPVGPVEASPHVLLGSVVVGAEELPERICRLPGVVVRDLGGDVVGDVRLADTVQDVLADGAHELSVDGGKGASGERPLVGGVVRENRVGVLEVGNEDEPAAGLAK